MKNKQISVIVLAVTGLLVSPGFALQTDADEKWTRKYERLLKDRVEDGVGRGFRSRAGS